MVTPQKGEGANVVPGVQMQKQTLPPGASTSGMLSLTQSNGQTIQRTNELRESRWQPKPG